jgi:hypothetical protein
MDELGIQPGPDLQRLSGQIVRHDPDLASNVSPSGAAQSPRTVRRRAAGIGVVAVAVGLIAAVVGLTWESGAAGESTGTDTRRSRRLVYRAPAAGRRTPSRSSRLDARRARLRARDENDRDRRVRADSGSHR